MTKFNFLDSAKDDIKKGMSKDFPKITDEQVYKLLYGFIAYEKADKLDKLLDTLSFDGDDAIFAQGYFKAHSETFDEMLQYIIRRGGKQVTDPKYRGE